MHIKRKILSKIQFESILIAILHLISLLSLYRDADTVRYVAADAGYDDHNLYDFTRRRGAILVCPIRRYRHTKGERLRLIQFNRTRLGRKILRARGVSIEPLFQCVKDAFGISVMLVYGFENVRSYVLMCVLVYQLAVYYNCLVGSDEPRLVKRMLGN